MSGARVTFMQPPHELGKAIVGPGPARMDPALLAKAEAAVEALEPGFPVWAAEYIARMRAMLVAARDDPSIAGEALATIFTLVMDLKGQAGSYGFLMITSVGDLLKRHTERLETLDERSIEIIEAHIDAMEVVLRDGVKGDGGELGRQLVEDLERLVLRPEATG